MRLNRKPRLPAFLRIFLWVFVVQLFLLNLSAALYAYKFTHFYNGPVPATSSQNVLDKTWKLFVGPRIYKMPYIAEPAFTYKEITLKTADTISINAWYSGADSINRCVIFFHGVTANKSVLLHEAAQFRQWGYNVLLIDFRGHGRSGGKATSFGVKETDEVEKAFQLARSKGNKRIILYGSSMGSMAVMKAVADNDVHPAAIIADMPPASLHEHLKARARVVGFPSEPFAFFVTLWMGIESGYKGFGHDVCTYARKINCPVLLQWGDRDEYVTKEETEAIYKSLGASQKKLVIYPNAGHSSFAQADPLLWNREVGGFINSL